MNTDFAEKLVQPFEPKIYPLHQRWQRLLQRPSVQPVGMAFQAARQKLYSMAGNWQPFVLPRTSAQLPDDYPASARVTPDEEATLIDEQDAGAFQESLMPSSIVQPPTEQAGAMAATAERHVPPPPAQHSLQALRQQIEAQVAPTKIGGERVQWLANLFGLRLDALKLYTHPLADSLVRRMGADAVTMGEQLFFRTGQLAPQTAAGLALLAHEFTHVAAQQGAAPLIDAATSDPFAPLTGTDEEAVALHNEWTVLHQWATHPPANAFSGAASRALPGVASVASAPAWSQPVVPPITGSTSSGAGLAATHFLAAQPALPPPAAATPPVAKLASSTRDRDPGNAPSPTVAPATELSPQQLRTIKEEVYRDLLARIRSEFERGA
ncbi:MAG: DUF4157 domain-containing protein [Caldilineaceae bacterium]